MSKEQLITNIKILRRSINNQNISIQQRRRIDITLKHHLKALKVFIEVKERIPNINEQDLLQELIDQDYI